MISRSGRSRSKSASADKAKNNGSYQTLEKEEKESTWKKMWGRLSSSTDYIGSHEGESFLKKEKGSKKTYGSSEHSTSEFSFGNEVNPMFRGNEEPRAPESQENATLLNSKKQVITYNTEPPAFNKRHTEELAYLNQQWESGQRPGLPMHFLGNGSNSKENKPTKRIKHEDLMRKGF